MNFRTFHIKKYVSLFLCAMVLATITPFFPIKQAQATTQKYIILTRVNTGKVVLRKGSYYSVGTKTNVKKSRIVYSSSNRKVAKVSKSGKIHALRNGKTTITARIRGTKVKTSIRLSVVAKRKYYQVKKLSVALNASTLNVGASQRLRVFFAPSKASNKNLVFKSSNTQIASISRTGNITALRSGSVYLTATSIDSRRTAHIKLTIIAPQIPNTTTPPVVVPPIAPTDPGTIPDKTVIDFADDVEIVPATVDYSVTTNGLILEDPNHATSIQTGDIIKLPGNLENPEGFATKVKTVSRNDEEIDLTCSAPTADEVFDSISIEATETDISSKITCTDGLSIEETAPILSQNLRASRSNSLATNKNIQIGLNRDELLAKVGADVSGSITLTPTLICRTDIDVKNKNIKNMYLAVQSTTSAKITVNAKTSGDISLGSISYVQQLSHGFFVEVVADITLNASGEISVVYTVNTTTGAQVSNNKFQPVNECSVNSSLVVDANLECGPEVVLTLGYGLEKFSWGHIDLAGVGAKFGYGIWITNQNTDANLPLCTNRYQYIYLKFSIDYDTLLLDILTRYNIPLTYTVWGKEKSIWRTCNHFEGITETNPCTKNGRHYNNGYVYTINNGTATVLDYYGGICSTLVFPETLGGVPVTDIGSFAFSGDTWIKEIALPQSLKHIDIYAFWNCDSLTSVNLPDSVTTVGIRAFSDCKNLKDIDLGLVQGIGGYAFSDCTAIEKLFIPKTLMSPGAISAMAPFPGCDNLTKVDIEDGSKVVACSLFDSCGGLTSVGPKGSGASVELPSSVTAIKNSAFSNCDNLMSVTLPSSVTTVDLYAFSDCKKLVSAMMPGVTYLTRYSFINSPAIRDVTLAPSCKIPTGTFPETTIIHQ